MYKRIAQLLIVLSILVLGISASIAEEKGSHSDMPEMTEEMKMMMANFQNYATPNENHEILTKLAGNWNAEVSYWMDPNGEPQISKGTSTAEVIFNGKFLQQNFSGTWDNQPFTGMGFYGYDNIKKAYTSIWFDDMGTGIMIASGNYNPETKVITEEGSMSCPITNSERWYRAAMTIIDENTHTYETYMKDVNGNEHKAMKIIYTRAQ